MTADPLKQIVVESNPLLLRFFCFALPPPTLRLPNQTSTYGTVRMIDKKAAVPSRTCQDGLLLAKPLPPCLTAVYTRPTSGIIWWRDMTSSLHKWPVTCLSLKRGVTRLGDVTSWPTSRSDDLCLSKWLMVSTDLVTAALRLAWHDEAISLNQPLVHSPGHHY